jgi:MoxR-like ATPase
MAAKTRAALQGRPEVSIEDLHAMAVPVLRHRLVVNYNAEAEGESADSVIKRLIDEIPVGGDAAASDAAVQRTLTS